MYMPRDRNFTTDTLSAASQTKGADRAPSLSVQSKNNRNLGVLSRNPHCSKISGPTCHSYTQSGTCTRLCPLRARTTKLPMYNIYNAYPKFSSRWHLSPPRPSPPNAFRSCVVWTVYIVLPLPCVACPAHLHNPPSYLHTCAREAARPPPFFLPYPTVFLVSSFPPKARRLAKPSTARSEASRMNMKNTKSTQRGRTKRATRDHTQEDALTRLIKVAPDDRSHAAIGSGGKQLPMERALCWI